VAIRILIKCLSFALNSQFYDLSRKGDEVIKFLQFVGPLFASLPPWGPHSAVWTGVTVGDVTRPSFPEPGTHVAVAQWVEAVLQTGRSRVRFPMTS
jgi:hypothetical protein